MTASYQPGRFPDRYCERQLRVEPPRSEASAGRSGIGALPSVAPVPARVSFTNPFRSLSLDGVNRSNCPTPAVRKCPSGSAQLGGKAAFPIWPAGEVHPSRAVINGLKPRHQTQRLFQFCRW